MKDRFLRFVCLALFAMVVTPVRAGTPMDNAFERMERAYKKLGEALKAPQEADQAAYLTLAEKIRTEAVTARGLEPKMTASLPEGDRPAFVAKFRGDMDTFIKTVDTLTAALREGRWDDARTSMQEMNQEKKDGHKLFRKKK
jgi:soluble cytochrome b562